MNRSYLNPTVDKVARLANREKSPAQIAAELGIQFNSVLTYLSHARRRGLIGKGRRFSIDMPMRIQEALSQAAAARGLTVDALACSILTIVVDDAMIDAVLDDKADAA